MSVVVHEVGGAQDGGVEAHLLDHPLDAELAREVRHVHVEVAVDHRQVDDPLDAGLAGEVERDQRLGEFVGHHRVEQEQRGDAREGAAQRVDIEQVALHDVDAGREVGLGGIADEGAHIGAALDELFDDLAADMCRWRR